MAAPSARALDLHDSLSPANFRRVAEFVNAYSGIKMPAGKKTMLEGRLRRCARRLGLPSLDAYCAFLFDEGGVETEAVHLIDAVTTNTTDFYREPAHFDFLMATALPGFLSEGRREVRVWSAASSIGAEPYTLAMLLDDFCGEHRGLDYSIFATDICTEVLRQAQLGIYPAAMVEPVPMAQRRRHLRVAREPGQGTVRIAPHLRAKVAFARLNLMDPSYPVPKELDIVFCRNILIYFDKQTQAGVLQRLCRHLRPGGYLFLGHSETAVGVDLPVRTAASTIFQKV